MTNLYLWDSTIVQLLLHKTNTYETVSCRFPNLTIWEVQVNITMTWNHKDSYRIFRISVPTIKPLRDRKNWRYIRNAQTLALTGYVCLQLSTIRHSSNEEDQDSYRKIVIATEKRPNTKRLVHREMFRRLDPVVVSSQHIITSKAWTLEQAKWRSSQKLTARNVLSAEIKTRLSWYWLLCALSDKLLVRASDRIESRNRKCDRIESRNRKYKLLSRRTWLQFRAMKFSKNGNSYS